MWMMELRQEIADVLARLPVRCDDNPELDKLRRLEAATAILDLPDRRHYTCETHLFAK
jgi:hypothetical protein